MRYYSDPTANYAVSNATKDWKKMARLALRLRKGMNNPDWENQMRRRFTGIYRKLLTVSIEWLESQIS